MKIVIYAGGMPFDGNTIPQGESLGGSESAAYYMARELAGLHHEVTVFTSKEQQGKTIEGVRYVWHGPGNPQMPLGEHFHKFMAAPQDVLIAQRHPQAFIFDLNAKIKLWWLHDLALVRNKGQVDINLLNTDKVLTVSEWHKEQVSEVYDIKPRHIVATHNGVDYGLFEGEPVVRDKREPGSMIYTARPERGLENLVREGGIMERLAQICPEAHLYVCGYNNTTPDMAAFYQYLWARCDALPNVTNLGFLGKDLLAQKLKQTMLHVYPTEFKDTSCIAVLEAQAAGTPVVTTKIAALPETLEGAGRVMLQLDKKTGRVDTDKFADAIKGLLTNADQWEGLHRKALNKKQTWADAAVQWDQLFKDIFRDKTSDKYRLHRHLERTSDIVAAEVDGVTDETMPGYEENYKFHREGDYAGHYARWYEHEKNSGVVYGPEDWTGNPRFEAVAMRVKGLYEQAKAEGCPFRVLDYGCAHGHYVMNLAARLPGLDITGLDIAPSNIEIAEKWLDDSKKNPDYKGVFDNVKFQVGEHDTLEGEFDLIITAEVLEHVPGPAAVVDRLTQHLSKDGVMLISIPYGPWESEGYYEEKNIGWRAHLHHFERGDLFDLWGHNPGYDLIAVPWKPYLGHYVLMFRAADKPSGQINYERKLLEQSPQETLSLCMIVKDAAGTLGGCLDKVKGVVDEIIIGIDETTKDNTREVAERYGAKIIEIESPLKSGFDVARNKTIEIASMDWILWLDADETFENAEHLRKYLRPNCYDGYGIMQHHYSAFPAQIMQTDLPVRVFRRSENVEFFGVVHEHAAQDENGKFDKIMVLPDVSIMHNGYATDAIRRKRFERNFPLMIRDRQKYPERVLGKMLWIRDLIQSIKYEMERNGGRMTPDMQARAQEAVSIWQWLVKKDLRMAKDSLMFYSEAVRWLGGGINFAINLGANIGPQGPDIMRQGPITGTFANVEDIKTLTDELIRMSTTDFMREYF